MRSALCINDFVPGVLCDDGTGLLNVNALQTANTSPNGTISTTGTAGHSLDVNAPAKTAACGGDVTPADAVAQYNPVHRKADGTLWAKTDAKDYSVHVSQDFPDTLVNSPTTSTAAAPSSITTLSVTNPSPCKPLNGIFYIRWSANMAGFGPNVDQTGTSEVRLNGVVVPAVSAGGNNASYTAFSVAALHGSDVDSGGRQVQVSIPPSATWTIENRLFVPTNVGARVNFENKSISFVGDTL